MKVRGRNRLRAEGFGPLLAVSRGSAQEPCFITLDYRGSETGNPTVLLGKGITFDSGGTSRKPSEGMEEMKSDIGGTAWTDERRGYQPEGATGVGVRLLTDWLMSGH